jgi:hypothetical protein
MATQIVGVNTTWSETGGRHRHISEVKTASGRVLARREVINRIQAGLEDFCTIAGGYEAKVIVVGCPFCAAGDYIKTTSDATKADNLLDLPSFTP